MKIRLAGKIVFWASCLPLLAATALCGAEPVPVATLRAAHRCDITKYGAIDDTKTVSTKAIQAAINACALLKTGGVVVVPKGIFLSGAIFLKQGVDLLVEKDGVLKGTVNPDDYPMIQTRWEGTEEPWNGAWFRPLRLPQACCQSCEMSKLSTVQAMRSPSASSTAWPAAPCRTSASRIAGSTQRRVFGRNTSVGSVCPGLSCTSRTAHRLLRWMCNETES
jgi:hypothetical protein